MKGGEVVRGSKRDHVDKTDCLELQLVRVISWGTMGQSPATPHPLSR